MTTDDTAELAGASIAAHTKSTRLRRRAVAKAITYAFLTLWAAAFLLPLYVMLVTSFKSMDEIRGGSMLALPQVFDPSPWVIAWSSACTGIECGGVRVGFWNSVVTVVPAVAGTLALGLVSGYGFALSRLALRKVVFIALMFGTFLPWQFFVFPLGRIYSAVGIYGSLWAIWITHIFFCMPITALLFKNYFESLPAEIIKAARVDGAGFLQLLWYVLLPMSGPIAAVAAILNVTLIWNNFLVGLVFGGREWFPMTVQLNNIVNSQLGEKAYNVNMAATILTAAVPLAIYFFSGRWFIRGISAGAVKG
ncbi:carbohydrate ABC transporter permease [Mesorhizobium sp. BAC0120]|uniref:carbohydrate ABC transporter permease n=1 Tax=Mesorhizobium sp. BAC0120 TaxID=3090670 RepID=UPI00298D56F5|nr:carbohydrate ABC transporter permease [Mesorhizobium sp. BAC0120]MDW6024212.1 carbohydrate ABC transporter permease [Mesorhizobium sp. BAC0120]